MEKSLNVCTGKEKHFGGRRNSIGRKRHLSNDDDMYDGNWNHRMNILVWSSKGWHYNGNNPLLVVMCLQMAKYSCFMRCVSKNITFIWGFMRMAGSAITVLLENTKLQCVPRKWIACAQKYKLLTKRNITCGKERKRGEAERKTAQSNRKDLFLPI